MCSPPWPPTGWCASESRAGRPRTTLSARRSPPESAAVSAAVYTGCSPPPWKQRTPTSRRSHDTTGSRATPLPRRARSSEAARRALAEHATREAAALADSGLALIPRSPSRAGLLDARAEARAAHGDLAGALADLHSALADSSPGPARSRRFSRLAMLTSGAQGPRRAAELAELALLE